MISLTLSAIAGLRSALEKPGLAATIFSLSRKKLLNVARNCKMIPGIFRSGDMRRIDVVIQYARQNHMRTTSPLDTQFYFSIGILSTAW